MPEVRLDIEGGKLDRKKEEPLTKAMRYRGIPALRLLGIPHTSFPGFIKLPTDRMRIHLPVGMLWRLKVISNGGARILRVIASWIEFHLSPSYVLFNLKTLSIVNDRKDVLGDGLLPVVDIGCFCWR
ncbi:MAG: hypothetical protein HXS40_07610 [Theionarchaea archaeon]|nr:hypothetical protein [Theionarchaea archaeon]